MADKSQTFVADPILQDVLSHGSFTGAATIYLALNTTASTPTAPGTEVVDSNYARQVVTWNAMAGNTSGVASVGNSGNFFSPSAASGHTVVELAIYNALTGGNLLYYAAVSPSVVISSGDTTAITNTNVTLVETGKPDGLAQATTNAFLRNGTYNGPVSVYAALNTTSSTQATPGSEIVDANYSRTGPLIFNGGVGGQDYSLSGLSWFTSGVATGPYTVVEVALYDAPTGGNELYYGPVSPSRTLNVGDKCQIVAGATGLVVSES